MLGTTTSLLSQTAPAAGTDPASIQQSNNPSIQPPPVAGTQTPYTVLTRSANARVWQKLVYEPTPFGGVVARKHSYAELASGLHYLDANGQWTESKEQILASPQGGASAVQGQHQAYFPYDLYTGVMETVTPDGLHLKSRPLGLVFADGTNTEMIAELTNSVGQLSANQATYTNAFTDLDAAVVFTYKKGSFESDVVFHQRPPNPADYGFNSATTRLQLWT
jgi:hypothetical protein